MAKFISAIPTLPSSDIERTARFFAETLGFAVVHQEPEFAVVKREHVEVHLWLAGDDTWKSKPTSPPVCSGAESFIAGTASCRIQVAGISELYRALEPEGVVHPNGKLQDKPWGDREFAVSDPDRNLITFFEPV